MTLSLSAVLGFLSHRSPGQPLLWVRILGSRAVFEGSAVASAMPSAEDPQLDRRDLFPPLCMGTQGVIMEAQAIDLTGDRQLFFGPQREAVAHAANLKCVISG